MFEYFDHTADLGIRARAASRGELFEWAAKALFQTLIENIEVVEAEHEIALHLSGDEDDYLLFDWLRELLHLFESDAWVFSKFQVTRTKAGIDAKAWGQKLDLSRMQAGHEVKAITYHGLRVEEESPGAWIAEVIVDI